LTADSGPITLMIMRMARNRIVSDERSAFYHVINRVAGREFLLGEAEKEVFVKLMNQLSEVYGIEILSYCVMSNHYHILLRKPSKEHISNRELITRWKVMYGEKGAKSRINELNQLRKLAGEKAYQEKLDKIKARFFDMSIFMQELQQRFTRYYNKLHGRKGTLWESRYKSVLVEGANMPLLRVAAYIELNPVRADMVKDPKDYRFCSYAAALGGSRLAKWGIEILFKNTVDPNLTWKDILSRYRLMMFGRSKAVNFDKKMLSETIEKGGRLSSTQLLHCRVRYMTDGLAIGSAAFVDEFLDDRRKLFGEKRKNGARKMRGGDWGGLCSFRDLQSMVLMT